MKRLFWIGWFAFGGVSMAACKTPPPPPFQFVVVVESDPGKRVEGALVVRDAATVATTGQDGRGAFSFRGREGDIFEVTLKCPAGYQSPAAALRLRLTRLAENKPSEYPMRCTPTARHLVLAIRADDGPNLPVYYLDKAVAKTDAAGAAHVYFADVKPGETLSLTVDASSDPKLSPTKSVVQHQVAESDEIATYNVKFHREKPVVRYAARPTGPTLIPFPSH